MCLSIPARVIELKENPKKEKVAVVERGLGGKLQEIVIKFNNPVKVGYYVFTSGDYAFNVISGRAAAKRRNRALKDFVKNELGCKCPDDVFKRMKVNEKIIMGNFQIDRRIIIGNKLLLYILFNDSVDVLIKNLPYIIEYGIGDREKHGFNRLRIVILKDNIEIQNSLTTLISKIERENQKAHVHVMSWPSNMDFVMFL
jgi:hydrogenase maturation factor